MCAVLIHSSHVQDGRTALMWAARCGHTAIVQYLVERTTAQVNATDSVSHSNSVQCISVHVHWVLVKNTSIIAETLRLHCSWFTANWVHFYSF